MVREIKFRAWNGRKMVPVQRYEQHYEKHHSGGVDIWSATVLDVQLATGEYLMYYDGSNMFYVMQFTGLKDKNGVEAYQDDVFRPWEDDRIYRIVWDDDYAAFKCKQLSGKPWPCDMLMVCYGEICGNIYENPEPLK